MKKYLGVILCGLLIGSSAFAKEESTKPQGQDRGGAPASPIVWKGKVEKLPPFYSLPSVKGQYNLKCGGDLFLKSKQAEGYPITVSCTGKESGKECEMEMATSKVRLEELSPISVNMANIMLDMALSYYLSHDRVKALKDANLKAGSWSVPYNDSQLSVNSDMTELIDTRGQKHKLEMVDGFLMDTQPVIDTKLIAEYGEKRGNKKVGEILKGLDITVSYKKEKTGIYPKTVKAVVSLPDKLQMNTRIELKDCSSF